MKNELNFYRLQNWKKVVRPRVKFLSPNWHFPQLALPPTSTSPNWHFPQLALFWTFCCAIENLSPLTAGTPLSVSFLALQTTIRNSREKVRKFSFLFFSEIQMMKNICEKLINQLTLNKGFIIQNLKYRQHVYKYVIFIL